MSQVLGLIEFCNIYTLCALLNVKVQSKVLFRVGVMEYFIVLIFSFML